MILQPNGWSCVPAAFAMATDIPVEAIIRAVGHDGSDIMSDGRQKGFTEHEMVDVLLDWDKYAICIWPDSVDRIGRYLSMYDGVLLGVVDGKDHAVFWNHSEGLVFDPGGQKYDIEKFSIERLYIIKSFS